MPSTRPIFWASVTASGRDGAHTRAWRPSNRPLMTQRVNWVLDLDIRTFFDSVDPGWLLRMLGHRIADPRVLRLIERWLKAGVLESGRWEPGEVGVPQGSGITPPTSCQLRPPSGPGGSDAGGGATRKTTLISS